MSLSSKGGKYFSFCENSIKIIYSLPICSVFPQNVILQILNTWPVLKSPATGENLLRRSPIFSTPVL